MESLVIFGVLGLLLAAVAPALFALRRRLADERQLELWRVLHRRGLGTGDAATDGRALAVAVRRCALCANVDTCNEWLAGGAGYELHDFCPNAGYVERLERQ